MSFGKRRSKPPRAQLRPSNPIDLHEGRQARQRARLARLACIGAAVLLTAAIVHGAGPPFTYRLGQRPQRELRVHVAEFRRKDPVRTNAERQAEADKVAPIMTNDPAPIRELMEQLEDLVDAVARVPDRESLSESLAAAWDLDAATFAEIHAAADSPERRALLHRRIAAAFAPLLANGVLGPGALPADEEAHVNLLVRSSSSDPPVIPPHLVTRDQVLPERLTKPDGKVAQQFAEAFEPQQALGRKLFALVAEKLAGTPTLKYEEAATIRARELARARVKDAIKTYRRGDVLVAQGERITEDHLALLKLEHREALQALDWSARLRRAGAIVVLVAALFALIGYYIDRHEPRIANSTPRIATLCALTVLAMGIVRLLALQPWDAELIPVALTAMILAIAYNPHFALMVTFALSLLTSLALGAGIDLFLILM
ncbi:MAG: hypothetical protein IRY99_26185, partial [Isosphaeraceae bacterium]|nr:hypothetical protein [Isosphaeraceae bacterium]